MTQPDAFDEFDDDEFDEESDRDDEQRGVELRIDDVDDPIQHLLRGEIEVEGRMPYSSNATFLVHVSHDGRSHPAIYKPVRGERPLWDFEPGLHRREVATYLLSEHLGLHVVPPTVLRDGPVGEGSVQWFVAADHSQHYFTIHEAHPDLHDQLRAMALLDILANNTDRKSGHVLLLPARDDRPASIWGIDNGLCFSTDYKLRTVIWEFGDEPIDDALLERVGTLCDRVPLSISALLTDDEVEALQGRGSVVRDSPAVPDGPDGTPVSLAAGLMSAGGQVSDDPLEELIHRGDLDGLVRMIDDRCSSRDWAGLLRVRDGSRHAVATGRQLWPAATLAEYRVALLATPGFVATVLDESDGLSGRFTIGPLTEVAAQHHSWAELAPELDLGPRAAFVAHERVLRGESVDAPDLPAVLDVPLELQPWEPDYALATYTDAGADFPMPDLPGSDPTEWESVEPEPAEMLDDDVELAVRQLVEPWLTGSNGQADIVCVDGDVTGALGALGIRRARIVELDPADALAWLAWAGASGGAHGRRRGAASGRFGAWWTLAALGDLTDDWPVPPDELGEVAHELTWYRWDAYEPELGWTLQLAVEDPGNSAAWAILAHDAT